MDSQNYDVDTDCYTGCDLFSSCNIIIQLASWSGLCLLSVGTTFSSLPSLFVHSETTHTHTNIALMSDVFWGCFLCFLLM